MEWVVVAYPEVACAAPAAVAEADAEAAADTASVLVPGFVTYEQDKGVKRGLLLNV